MKRKIVTVVAVIFLLVAVSIGIAIYMTPPLVSGDLSMAYKQMVKEQVLAQWECTPVSDREELMLSLIDRFSPEDRALIKRGRVWKEGLRAKEKAGTLTVSERDKLYSGYYHDTQDKFEHSIKVRTGNFSKPICDEKPNMWWQQAVNNEVTCKRPYLSVTDSGLIYEDDYSRWAMDEWKWVKAIENELKGMSKRDAAYSVSHYQETQAANKKKAREQVLSLPASQAPEGSVEQMIETEYRKLSCSVR
ncbi:MAG: hypothetical protein H6869_03660 [Rhodospirillales bacterium]|nr:hypothetical protein [Rhodospirillales bacterium]